MEQTFYRICKFVLVQNYNFCPYCGLKIKEEAISVSITSQIGIYLLSILLPPLGLFPGIKYPRKGNEHAKHVRLIAIFFTILGIILSVWAFYGFIHSINSALNQQINLKQLGN
jgi:hypothetical protein